LLAAFGAALHPLTLGHQFDAIGNSLYVHRLWLFLNFNDFLASLLRKENACLCTSAHARTTVSSGRTCVRIDINLSVVGIALHLVVQVVIRESVI
jgi:hypothetical protein